MTDFQLPVPVTDLFAAFGITDPAQMLIFLLSSMLGVLLLLIVFIAFRGRPHGKRSLPNQSNASMPSTDYTPPADPFISVVRKPVSNDTSAAQQTDNGDAAAARAAEQVEDFQIFKRPKQKSRLAGRSISSLAADDQMSTADHLRLIEKEMVRLRDLYQDGHITRDMYIDETQSLYHQARGLSSFS